MSTLLTWPVRLIVFSLWFAGQIVTSSWAVIRDIMTPGLQGTPRVVRMPLESRSDFQVTLIGTLITLTPGTLTLGVVEHGPGSRALLVHSMYHPDTEQALDDLWDMERRMLHALAREGVA